MSDVTGATVRVYRPAPVEVRSWRSLWRKRLVTRDVVIFAGRIQSGLLATGLNQPARLNIQAVDALASFQDRTPDGPDPASEPDS